MNFQPRIRSASEPNPGVVCCTANDPEIRCDTCKSHFDSTRAASTNSHQENAEKYDPPDTYGLKALQTERTAANATPESFESRYRKDRLRELAAEHVAMAAAPKPTTPPMRRLTAAESAKYAPPDSYNLAKLQAKENR